MSPTDGPPSVVEVYADVVCPFTHVGLHRLVEHRHELGLATPVLRLHAWPLELVNGEPVAASLVAEEIRALREQVAPDLFTGFDQARFPSTSLPALALAARAYRVDDAVGERTSIALRDALFERGLDISNPEVLASIGESNDLDAVTPEDIESVSADLVRGRARGVVGSPHFFVGEGGFFCPTLDISQDDAGRFRISQDEAAFRAFTRQCFGEAAGSPSP